ncbi:zinc finger BED domain-containing protein RICESLEEPER 1-like [Pyrus communis]|uniref:zinc finger BED domain-containing protein RICESLEEPER 1-like n=1 Tax=Pyrus communis TaxID=23211 RepID=UPI0035C2351A
MSDHGIEGSVVGGNDGMDGVSIPSDSDTRDNVGEGVDKDDDVQKATTELAVFMYVVGLLPFKVVEDNYYLWMGHMLVEYDEQKTLRAVADFVCSIEFPPTLVKHPIFRNLALRLNPRFNLTYGMVRSECMKVYGERKLGIKEFFENFNGQISLSVDLLRYQKSLSFDYDSEVYLCLYAHFVDENWKLRKWVLYFRHLSDSSDDCGEDWGIFKSIQDWGIEDKISAVTTTNFDYLAEYVKTHIQEKNELQLGGQLFNVNCLGKTLSLMVEDAFEEIEDLIDKVSLLYSSKSLPLWYLTSSKLKPAIELYHMGEFSSKDVTDDYDVPSPDEWKTLEGVCNLVDSIYEVANALFETKHPTPNVYLYHLHEIREVLTTMSVNSDSFIRTIVEEMLKKFHKYWDDTFLLMAMTAALDPRFKMKYVEFVCSKVKGDDADSQVAAVLGAIHKMFDEYVIRFPENESFVSDSSSLDSDSEGESPDSTPPLPPKNLFGGTGLTLERGF